MNDTLVATIASDEDLEYVFVLADEAAPTEDAAWDALIRQCQGEWAVEIKGDRPDGAKRPYRYREELEEMRECRPSHPDAEWWWRFHLADCEVVW